MLQHLDAVGVALRVIADRATKSGIKLGARDLRSIRQQLERRIGDKAEIRLWRWPWWETRELSIVLTEEDLRDIGDEWERLFARLPELILTTSDQVADDLLRTLKRRWRSEYRVQSREQQGFRRRLRRRWREPLDLYGMLIAVAFELGDQVADEWRRQPDDGREHLGQTLLRLHARSCQVASEILALLEHGFADGAMARWRTMHEIAVTASFLSDHGNETAERYLLHDVVEAYRALPDYQRHCEALGEASFSATEAAEMKARHDALVLRFGREFAKPYGWAAAALRLPKPTFADIERASSLEHLRPYYRMASQNVHATPKGILFRLGLTDEAVLLAGPSNIGLADPGQSAAISLMQVTASLLQLAPTLDHIIAARTIQRLVRDVCEAFGRVHSELGAETPNGIMTTTGADRPPSAVCGTHPNSQ